ncbi:MAG TPA: SDR family oxidoreductase [Mycobacteriales bacterium]|nr:SDR family oxidoreductase [Mycobacteriales bacterium]
MTDVLRPASAPAETSGPRAVAPRGVAVVTGGTAGLGRATVRELAKDGWDVAVLARGRDALQATCAEVVAAGRRAIGIPTDVADHEQVELAADQVERELGPIGLWVNNAMTGVFAPFTDVLPEDFERANAVTYLGFVNGTRAALRRMKPRDAGTIVQVGSALAFRGIPLQAAYCGAKHAMVGFTESVITELLHDKSKVRVAMVHMPALNTPQFDWVKSALPHHPQPVPPIYAPEVGARAIAHVARHPRRATWVGVTTTGTILGNRVIAPLLDRYLGRTGYKSQQTTKDAAGMLRPNLYEPVPGDQGAHGDFTDRSHGHSPATWLGLRRWPLTGLGAVAVAALALRRTRR